MRQLRFESERVATRARPPLAAAIALALSPSAGAAPDVLSLDALDGHIGLRLDGDATTLAEANVAHVGDVNGDGLDDLVVGLPKAPGGTENTYGYTITNGGRLYVLFGDTDLGQPGAASSRSLSALDGTDGFAILGCGGDNRIGTAVTGLGDVNGDGRDDFAFRGQASRMYVVLGSSSFPASLDLCDVALPGFTLTGSPGSAANLGPAGDLNGDGFDDIVFGVHDATAGGIQSAGQTFVVFGRSSFASTVNLGTLDGTTGFRLDGTRESEFSGYSVAAAGDVNGDGLDDLAIGAIGYGGYGYAPPATPRAYVLFGRDTAFPATLGLASLDGSMGFHFENAAGSLLGWSVAGVGDVNADAREDLLIGELGLNRSWLLFGRASFPASFGPGAIDASTGLRLDGEVSTNSGRQVAAAGDHDGDGIDDLLIAAPSAGLPGASGVGRSYVVHGRASFGAATLALGSVAGSTGYRINGSGAGERAGYTLATPPPRQRDAQKRRRIGDLNGDGAPDLAIGTSRESASLNPARAYIVFATPEVTPTPLPGATVTLNDFANDPVATTAGIALGNVGGVALSASIVGPPSAPYSAGFPGLDATIDPHTTGTATVGCQSVASSPSPAPLLIATDDPDEPALEYTLTCTAIVSSIQTSPPIGAEILLTAAAGATASGEATYFNAGLSPLNIHTCVASAGFARSGQNFPLVVPVSGQAALGVSCTAPAAGTSFTGTLTCSGINDNDTVTVVHTLRCAGVAGPVATFSSSPVPGSTLTLSGPEGEATASRRVRIANVGNPGSTLQVSGCAVDDPRVSVQPTALSIAQGAPAQDLIVSCELPDAAGEIVNDVLTCSTNDPARAIASFALSCSRPATTIALPQDPLTDANALPGDNFGTAVAVSDADAAGVEIVAVGAPKPESGSGEVHLFVRTPADDAPGGATTAGLTRAKDVAPAAILSLDGGNLGDKFGGSVAVSPDGERVVIGVPGRDTGGEDRGTVFVFRKPPGGWTDMTSSDPGVIQLTPTPGNGVAAQGFGESVAIDETGRVVVGAPLSERGALTDAGAAFVFAPDGPGFVQQNVVVPPASEDGARFGEAVAMRDGLLAIGAPEEDEGNSEREGALYTYAPTGADLGTATRTVRSSGGIGDKFGGSVAIAGGMVVVGAPEDDTLAGESSGSATVFVRGPGAALDEGATLEPPIGAFQGAGRSVSTNGDTVVVGAPLATVSGSPLGRALVFDLPPVLPARLTPTSVLENASGAADDGYGRAVAVGRRRLVVGVPFDDRADAQPDADDGRADPYLLDRIFRAGGE